MSGYKKKNAPNFDVEIESRVLRLALDDPQHQREMKALLGPDIDFERFKSSAIDAINHNADLCNPDPQFRASLFYALKRAAKQGLEPDASQGVLIPRWNEQAKARLVSWSPMVKGVILAGRRAGVCKSLTAQFVLRGEPFRVLSGDDDRIEHEWIPDIRERAYGLLRQIKQVDSDDNSGQQETQIVRDIDGFWDMVVASYCIITLPDGSKFRRVMPRARLLLVRDVARSSATWRGAFLDEMIVKVPIHWTFKHVPIDPNADPDRLARFRDALDQDMDADFDKDTARTIEHSPSPPSASVGALPAPHAGDKLGQFERPREREPVERDSVGASSQDQRPHDQRSQQEQERSHLPVTASSEAFERAKAFVRSTKEEIARLTRDELDALLGTPTTLGNAKMRQFMDRLNEAFPDLHDEIVHARSAREIELNQGEAA